MRSRDSTSDSLDLLLDAISNAFGVILLIALLVALQLQLVSRTDAQRTDAAAQSAQQLEAVELAGEIESLEVEIEMQQSAQAQLAKTMAFLARTTDQKKVEQLLQARDEHQRLSKEQSHLQSTMAKLRENDQVAELEEEQILEQQKERAAVLAQLQGDLRTERTSKARDMEPPVVQSVGTMEFVVILRYGKVYIPYFQSLAQPMSINWNDMVLMDRSILTGTTLTPNPAAGSAVRTVADVQAFVRNRLRNVTPRQYHITILAWDDSFSTYRTLRDALRDLGFRIRLLPADGDSYFTNTGGPAEAQ